MELQPRIGLAFAPAQDGLRAGVRDLLTRTATRDELESCHRTPQHADRHLWNTYAALGERGWLAPHWPAAYGGLDGDIGDAAAVAEEMALCGIPDSARTNTIDNAGNTILEAGSESQKRRYLPPMARGEMIASVLYSEPGAGSDLAALKTRATRIDGGGWRVSGTKIWNVLTPEADFGICAACTAEGGSKYSGLSLFLVPLRQAGVGITPIDGPGLETFYRVDLDTEIPAESLVGDEGGGWAIINNALGLERTGVCFYGRARRWLDLLRELIGEDPGEFAVPVRELDTKVEAARLLAWRAVGEIGGGPDTDGDRSQAGTAAAKWWTSELAQEVARMGWAIIQRGAAVQENVSPSLVREFERAVLQEAPGLTLAAGTSEIMLSIVASELLDDSREVREEEAVR